MNHTLLPLITVQKRTLYKNQKSLISLQLPNTCMAPNLAAPGGHNFTSSSNREAVAIADHNASRTPIGQSPNLVPGNALQILQVFQGLQQSLSTITEQLTVQTPTPSQEVQLQTSSLTIADPHGQDTVQPVQSISLFDPSGLVEKKFFAGAPDNICAYLTKHFSQLLGSEHQVEMAKRYKRPDIPSMRVHKLDSQLHKRDFGFVKTRDDTLKDIQRTTLQAVGPLCELITKVSHGHIITQDQMVEYASATLVLLGSTATKILLARRKNAIKSVNPALVSELQSLKCNEQSEFVFGPDNLKALSDAQKDRSTFDKLAADRPAKRQKTEHKPYYSSCDNANFKPNQFFRKGPTEGTGFSGADQRKSRGSYPRRPYRGNISGQLQTLIPLSLLNSMLTPSVEPPMTGRLPYFYHNWALISPGNNILGYIEGLILPLTSTPNTSMQTNYLPKEQTTFVHKEIERLLSIKAIQVTQFRGFTSPIFLRKKSSGQWRLILNLKLLNKHLTPPHFKMEGIHCVQYMVTQGDYITKIDLKHAYLTVAVHMNSRKYLQFEWNNTLYQYTTMPFGLNIAPFIFTKIMKRPVAILRGWGVRLLIYQDDILIVAHDPNTASLHTDWVIIILSQLGFVVNHEKSILTPKQVIEFLGFMVNTTIMTFQLPLPMLTNIKTRCKAMIRNPTCTARQLAALLGLLSFSKTAINLATIYYRTIQFELIRALHASRGNYNHLVTLGTQALQDLKWWISSAITWNTSPILKPNIDHAMQTDASLTGWGVVCKEQKASGLWSPQEKQLHINTLELKAIMFGVNLFSMPNTHVLIQTDNRAATNSIDWQSANQTHQ